MLKNTFVLISFILFLSCENNSPEKSKELTAEAIKIFYSQTGNQVENQEASLELVNKAIKYDATNVTAKRHKITILMRERKGKEVLAILDEIIQQHPKLPFYIQQKAMVLSLEGREDEARLYYEKAISLYETLLVEKPDLFDLRLGYVNALEIANKQEQAIAQLNAMREMDLPPHQKEILDHYKFNQIKQNQYFKQFWRGEISFNELSMIQE